MRSLVGLPWVALLLLRHAIHHLRRLLDLSSNLLLRPRLMLMEHHIRLRVAGRVNVPASGHGTITRIWRSSQHRGEDGRILLMVQLMHHRLVLLLLIFQILAFFLK